MMMMQKKKFLFVFVFSCYISLNLTMKKNFANLFSNYFRKTDIKKNSIDQKMSPVPNNV